MTDLEQLADQLAAIDPELAERLRATPRWLSALLDPDFRMPTHDEVMVAERRAGRARRQVLLMEAAAATGQTVLVLGPDGGQLHHPDGTVEPWEPTTLGAQPTVYDECLPG